MAGTNEKARKGGYGAGYIRPYERRVRNKYEAVMGALWTDLNSDGQVDKLLNGLPPRILDVKWI